MRSTMIATGSMLSCLLCGESQGSHNGGDYDDSECYEALKALVTFIDLYREGCSPGKADLALKIVARDGVLKSVKLSRRVAR